ncbi:hypothetical protein [Nocardioides jejuensis]|uniref:Lipoprotein n=1 Tax=Nocardioides jejuensis TaxID=2502782 RepID=A0A4R1BUB6_9ACTN|nr:hypothetical protein [Nocardioides jejuensis]TCJ21311.1 hypothetical protein EPD65_15450 [Nocardioides jejuensis]
MQTKRIAAAVATVALAGSLAACGDAVKNAADQAKSKTSDAAAAAASKGADAAKDAASKAADQAKGKAGELGNSLLQDIKSKLSPEQQKKLEFVDTVGLGKKGELVEDADSLTVADYFGARQEAAANSGEDLSDLQAVAAGRGLRNATRYVTKFAGQTPKFSIEVVSSDAGTVNACAGPKGKKARTLIVKDGKVVANRKGTHTC